MNTINEHLDRLVLEPGPPVPAWTARVAGWLEYNRYELELTEIVAAGQSPLPLPGRISAYNLAEPFQTAGTLAIGTNVIVWRAGSVYVFNVSANV